MSTRTNLITNPSAEGTLSGTWSSADTVAGTPTLAPVADPNIGTYAMEYSYTAEAGDSAAYANLYSAYTAAGTAAAGDTFTLSAYIKKGAGTNSGVAVKLRISEFNTGHSWQKDNTGSDIAASLTTSFQRFSYTVALSDADTTCIYGDFNLSSVTNGDAFDIVIDNVLLEKTDSLDSYFDGDTTDTPSWVYDWSGAANASVSTAMTTANLVVPIELPLYGYGSLSTGETTFARSATALNAANYDGTCTYEFEIVAVNADTADRTVSLYDSTNAAVKSTIVIPAGVTAAKRFRSTSAFTPAAGNNVYEIRTPQVTTSEQVKVYTARIVITQVGATKTRIQVPLMAYAHSNTSSGDTTTEHVDSTKSATYSFTYPDRHSQWLRTDSAWGTVASYDFEALIAAENASYAASATLWNVNDGAEVTGAALTTTSTSWVRQTANFAPGATGFHDGDTYEARIKSASASYYCRILTASLYLNVTDTSKGEVYWRTAGYMSAATADMRLYYQRIKLDLSSYSSPVCYHEATCSELTAAESVVTLCDYDTRDTGTSGAVVLSSATIAPPGSLVRGLVRSGVVSGLTDGYRYFSRKLASTYSVVVAAAFLVVTWSEARTTPVSGTITPSVDLAPEITGWVRNRQRHIVIDMSLAVTVAPPGGESSYVSDSIDLEVTWTRSLLINGGAPVCYAPNVGLSMVAASSAAVAADMRFSDDGVSWSAWEAYATSRAYTLSGVYGVGKRRSLVYYVVYAQFRDADGNTTEALDVLLPCSAVICTVPIRGLSNAMPAEYPSS